MRRPLCEQPHCCGDQPQRISLRQIYHTSREHEAIVDTAALQCPLKVTQTQRTIPVCSRIGQMECLFRCFLYLDFFWIPVFLYLVGFCVLGCIHTHTFLLRAHATYRLPCRLRVFRQNERTCPSRRTVEKQESSVERRAEGKPSGQTPAHNSPLPQSSVSRMAKCCSITCWACWRDNNNALMFIQLSGNMNDVILWKPLKSAVKFSESFFYTEVATPWKKFIKKKLLLLVNQIPIHRSVMGAEA